MSERDPTERRAPERYECPHLDRCYNSVDQKQFEIYCTEVAPYRKQPNYAACPVYAKLLNSPREWKRKIASAFEDEVNSPGRRR